MSRSSKKIPIVGIAGGSDKQDKRLANRKLRRKTKEAIHSNKEVMPKLKEVSDEWDMSKDGKIYIGGTVRK